MATVIGSISIYFGQPWWLALSLLLVPAVWLGVRSMTSVGTVRRTLAMTLRCVGILLLVILLARLKIAQQNEHVTVVAVIDRSQSIPPALLDSALLDLEKRLITAQPQTPETISRDRLAVVDIAEAASISALGANAMEIRKRNTTLMGTQSRLADGVQMAMAIAPPDTATRIILLSDGNETAGNLKEAARIAASNGIPIDVMPIEYEHASEVVFQRVAAPVRARSGETIALRFILHSTTAGRGRLLVTMNDKPVDLSPADDEVGARIELQPGTNVKTVELPVGSRGMHEFKAFYIPDDSGDDGISENNQATAMTFVAGPGHILIVDSEGTAGQMLAEMMSRRQIDARRIPAEELPDNLARLMDADAVLLINTDASQFTFQQQEMLARYVTELGGGLVMTGGDRSFGAGGWIGSPVAQVLPVDCDPPQKKQMPKGALVLIMHACEMPNGNLWGKRVAGAAVRALSRQDLAGVLNYGWRSGSDNWVYPLSEVGDKTAVINAIDQMQMGDMPDFGPHMQGAYDALTQCDAAQKHVILISDGDPQMPPLPLLMKFKEAGITATGVAVFPHSANDVQSLMAIAQTTGGRFYNVADPQQLPQIFIKEAQVVRRALILEETFNPKMANVISEIIRGIDSTPPLDGYVLTGPKGGLAQTILTSHQDDPILAAGQAGLGRCAAFTSALDSRWAAQWLGWDGFESLWAQMIRWVGKPAQGGDCEVTADVQGQEVTVQIEAADEKGQFTGLSQVEAQVISPDVRSSPMELIQTGPGQYQGRFQADRAGSYVVNLRYRTAGGESMRLMQTPVTVPFAPEFRDLRDNRPLMEEVGRITGGRIVNLRDPQTDLFDKAGLKYPQTQLPITPWLMGAWMSVFLLDVAVRRVAVDVAAMRRKVVGWVMRKTTRAKPDDTLNRLKQTHLKMQNQLKSRISEQAGRRYESASPTATELPTLEFKPPSPAQSAEPAKIKPQAEQSPPQTAEHIQQLLKAKRKAYGPDSRHNKPSDPRQEK